MSNNTLRIIFILSVICAVLMIATQFFWIKKAYELEKNLFNIHATVALKNVAVQLRKMNGNTSPVDSIVNRDRVDEQFYTVQVNDKIDSSILESLLRRELLEQQLKTDFEYSVYDCATENMKYGKYVSYDSSKKDGLPAPIIFPKSKKENNYFSVHFPMKNSYLTKEMSKWFFSTFILFLFLIILAYAIFTIFKQKRLAEIQKDFVNNMTHEFKTPLATIKISSEVLRNPNIIHNPERLLNYATIISNETIHLINQVERVLQMAKSGKEKIELNKEWIELKPLLEESIDKTYKPLIRSRGGNIEISLQNENLKLFGDRLHLKNVIGNLLDNAIKYCNEKPSIKIIGSEDNLGIHITVKDNGIGITKENIPLIFEKFYRIPTGNLHDVKGFGIGLNYVQLICKQHGGSIKVISELDKGSEFCIFIPNNLKS